MTKQFNDTDATLAVAFRSIIAQLDKETLTLRELLELIGEQGLLLFCILLTLPFLLPVSIPGVSTVSGIVIILIGIGVTFNRVPWLPHQLMNRTITREHLLPVLEHGAKVFDRLEHWVKPRFQNIIAGIAINRINGFLLTLGGIFLLFPLSFVPFSNTLPALVILCLSFGILQQDGYFIVAGYTCLCLTLVYFGVLALLLIVGGQVFLF